jgi:hypothetical protein
LKTSEDKNIMKTLLIIAGLLATAISGFGQIPSVVVTPTNLDLHDYAFAISTNAAQDGTGFHLIITAKTRDIPTNSSVNLEVGGDEEFSEDTGIPATMGRAAPPVKVSIKKNNRIWEADFVVPRQQLRDHGLFCLFGEAYDGETGGAIDPKTVTFYEIKIQEFVSPSIAFTQRQAPITRKDLIAMWQDDMNRINWLATNQAFVISKPHYYYMGTGKKSGYDYIAIVGGPHSLGAGSYRRVAVRGGELPIENRYPVLTHTTFVPDPSLGLNSFTKQWQEIDVSKL